MILGSDTNHFHWQAAAPLSLLQAAGALRHPFHRQAALQPAPAGAPQMRPAAHPGMLTSPPAATIQTRIQQHSSNQRLRRGRGPQPVHECRRLRQQLHLMAMTVDELQPSLMAYACHGSCHSKSARPAGCLAKHCRATTAGRTRSIVCSTGWCTCWLKWRRGQCRRCTAAHAASRSLLTDAERRSCSRPGSRPLR